MEIFKLFGSIFVDTASSDESLDSTRQNVDKTSASIGKFAAGAGAAALALAGASAKTGKDFEKSMSQVAATMGIAADKTNKDYAMLSAAAKEMGATTKYSATQAAEALNYLALAGYNAEQSVEALPKVLDLAAAGNLDLGYATDLVTDSMSALGLEMDELDSYIDKTARTSQRSNTSIKQLGEAILTAGGTAKTMSGGVTEINTVLGLFADNGVKGSEAGTALRNIINDLTGPTDKAKNVLKELGVVVEDATTGQMRPMKDIIADLEIGLDSMGATAGSVARAEYLNQIFGARELKSVNALLGTTSERWTELTSAIENSDGAASQMAATMQNNLAGTLTTIGSQLEGLGIQAYEKMEKPLKSAAENVSKGLAFLADNFDVILAILGPLTLGFGLFAIAVNMTKILGAVTNAFAAFNAVLAANPIGLAVAAGVALVAMITALDKALNKPTAEMQKLLDKTKELTEGTKELTEAMKNSKAAYDERVTNIEAQVGASMNLLDRIRELNEVEDKSAEQKQLLAAYVSTLNENMEGLNLAYDIENDALSDSIENIQRQIEARGEQAKALAAQERAVEIAREQIIVEEQLVNIREQMEELQTAGLATTESVYKQGDKVYNVTVKNTEAYQDLLDAEAALMEHQDGLQGSFEFTTNKIVDAMMATQEYADETEAAADRAALAAEAMAEAQEKALKQLADEYISLKTAATDLFNALSDESGKSVAEMNENLDQSQGVISRWTENMDTLTRAGIDQGFLDYLRELGPKAAGEVQNLVNAIEDDPEGLQSLSDKFAKGGAVALEALKTVFGVTDEVAAAAKGVADDSTKSLADTLEAADIPNIGRGFTHNFANGILGGIDMAVSAAQQVAEAARAALGGGSDIADARAMFSENEMLDGRRKANERIVEQWREQGLWDDKKGYTGKPLPAYGTYAPGWAAGNTVNNYYDVKIDSKPQTPSEIATALRANEIAARF